MDYDLRENWNDKVGPKDTVYHLGDFCWGKADIEHNIPKLNGNIILLPGNHDNRKFLDVYRNLGVTIREPHFYKENKVKIWLSHYAHLIWPEMHYGSRHLYGHSHGSSEKHTKGLCFDVGVDCTDYSPLSFQEVMDRFSKMESDSSFESHMTIADIQKDEWTRYESYFR